MLFAHSFKRSYAAARAEQVGGFIVEADEPLRLPCRFGSALDFLALARGSVRSLNTIVTSLVSPVIHVQTELPQGRAVAAQFVRHDDAGSPQRTISREMKRFAAPALRRVCTRMSRTLPLLSTARHSQCFTPLIGITTSSTCHLSFGRGRSRRIQPVKCAPN